MSGESRRAGAPQGPPWSLDLLADLHAGVLDGPTADELRRQVEADPEAREIMAALDATSADLADLPPLTIPDDVSASIEAALQAEVRARSGEEDPTRPVPTMSTAATSGPAGSGGQVVDFAAAKARRRRRMTLGAGLVGVAAAAAAVIFAVLPGTGGDSNTAQPQAPSPQQGSQGGPLALAGDQVHLDGQQFSQVMSSDQYVSTLADPQQLIGCLQANGVRGGKPMGAREITLNGKPAQLLVLPGGGLGKFRLLAVGPDCGSGNPSTISDSTFGG
ncbi:hypothetical protein [Saccharopolyspora flava]|uniref:Anti-sigma-M factor RsmA n=1 Tax=Saccharopolyspora flava TaxID=95161 RepID=A0A1I6T7H7_9PSEU|nr:hypothetical protein [Saccharopolyspora flava]SFS85159.1 hypothetical protein SAMN05660874_03731 [Saccharopolyspora flava]